MILEILDVKNDYAKNLDKIKFLISSGANLLVAKNDMVCRVWVRAFVRVRQHMLMYPVLLTIGFAVCNANYM